MNVLKVHMKMLQERKSVIIFPVGAIKREKYRSTGTGISFIVHNVPCKVIPTQIWIYGLDKNEGLAFKKFFQKI